ncbi:hypothetical protein BO99DRAFT_411656 [Aspergillus violaceofuscus CBS 115571]|uniref:Uncharacterized protein n=1 Tax=Aspergillus violaceofuscus (strain CBS 115571) TaxID=1450538 RepID=A0A2V5H8K3_ASPV1|nr:hypothetical protein BO99DRAFT_411656 [Aspergillus violaceofuscus CBS 115571]
MDRSSTLLGLKKSASGGSLKTEQVILASSYLWDPTPKERHGVGRKAPDKVQGLLPLGPQVPAAGPLSNQSRDGQMTKNAAQMISLIEGSMRKMPMQTRFDRDESGMAEKFLGSFQLFKWEKPNYCHNCSLDLRFSVVERYDHVSLEKLAEQSQIDPQIICPSLFTSVSPACGGTTMRIRWSG